MTTKQETIQRPSTSNKNMKDNNSKKGVSKTKAKDEVPFPDLFLVMLLAVLMQETIPLGDLAFCLLYPTYLFTANALRFDNNQMAKTFNKPSGLQFQDKGKHQGFFVVYIISLAVVGVCIPLLLSMGIWVSSRNHDDGDEDDESRKVATYMAPHLAVLLVQIIMEHVGRMLEWHAFIQCLTPIGFGFYREFTLATWTQAAYIQWQQGETPHNLVVTAGLVLAVLNTAMWTYNCFVFLLLRIMPSYLNQDKFPVPRVAWWGQLIPLSLSLSSSSQKTVD